MSIGQCCKPPIMPPCPGTTSFLFADKLAKYQRFIDVIIGDGNCFFRTISKELFGTEKFHPGLRQILVAFVTHNPSLFQALDFTNNFKKHCNKMSRNGIYATQVELQATATFLQLPLYVSQNHLQQKIGNGLVLCHRKLPQHLTNMTQV